MHLDHSHLLIARTDNIGDVVLTLPVAGYLKSRHPSMRIGFICRGYAAPFVRLCDAVDYVIEIDKLTDPVAQLAELGVDTILFSKPDKRLAAAAKKARIPNRVGTSHRLYHWIYCNHLVHFSRVKSSLHEAQLNFELLRPFGIGHMPALEDMPSFYQLKMPAYNGPIPLTSDRFNLIIHPKSNGNGREWPIAHFVELAKLMQATPDVQLWVTGSASEQKWLEENGADLLRMPNVTSVCGKFTLDELAAFIAAADGLIASGTGPLHMSAALGQRTLGLFPPLRPIHPGRWAPLGARAQVLCMEQTCPGCKEPSACACMRAITPQQVADVVAQWRRPYSMASASASAVTLD